MKPRGGSRIVENALQAFGRTMDDRVRDIFSYVKTHNEAVFDLYTPEMRAARKAGLLTGLPDAYGRGRLIGDYRRVALYGVDTLIQHKRMDKNKLGPQMDEETMRLREEVSEQIRALEEMKKMATAYGLDIRHVRNSPPPLIYISHIRVMWCGVWCPNVQKKKSIFIYSFIHNV